MDRTTTTIFPKSRSAIVGAAILLASTLTNTPGTATAADVVVGAGTGLAAEVAVIAVGGGTSTFFAYEPQFTGGVRVAAGDVNGDGVADIITGAGPGGGPHVRVFDGSSGRGPSSLLDFFAGDEEAAGGVFVAAGDVNGDGFADIITGAGAGGGPRVRVFDGTSTDLLLEFAPEPFGFSGGIRVASGDVNGDGTADIITSPGAGGGPHVRVFDGRTATLFLEFDAYEAAAAGGVFVAAGDINGDGVAEIVTGPGAGGGPHVKVFDGRTGAHIDSIFPHDSQFSGGVRVATGDINGDGAADIITGAGPGGGPHVKVFSGRGGGLISDTMPFGDAPESDAFVGNVTPVCGNGAIEASEQCDDGNKIDGDSCDSNCRFTGCGNFIVSAGEECDDGNTRDADCCDASCMFPSGCLDAEKATITLSGGPKPSKRSFGVIMKKVPEFSPENLGDPTDADEYSVCIRDDEGPVLDARVPGGRDCGKKPCWKRTSNGVLYKDGKAAVAGVKQMLVAGNDSKPAGKAIAKGKGAGMKDPGLALTGGATAVVVQGTTGFCIEGRADDVKKNTPTKFKATR